MISVQSKSVGYYFVVGSYQPGRAEAAKGGGVHSLKINVSWVKNVARQFGCNFARCIDQWEVHRSTKGNCGRSRWCRHCQVACVQAKLQGIRIESI